MKTFIAVPSMDLAPMLFTDSLAMLEKEGETVLGNERSSLIYSARNNLAAMAVEKEADRILWLDSDMVFPSGTLIHMQKVLDELGKKAILTGAYFRRTPPYSPVLYKKLDFDEKGNASFDLIRYGTFVKRIKLSVAGNHNVSNALSVLAVSDLLEIPLDTAQKGILSFTGTNRRFQYKGERNGFTIIDDYAHHPTEIKATLTSVQNYPHREVWCIFQPHTYTRTKAFFHEFAEALSLADHVILADIYAARETDTLGMSSKALAEEVQSLGVDAHYFPSFEEIENFVVENCIHGDVLITMGAGDVVNIGDSLLK